MSDMYKEALMDAKKLREVAMIDAKNRIIEKVSPFVQEMINKEIKTNYLNESIFVEQEDMPEDQPADPAGGLGDAGAIDTAVAPETTDTMAQDGVAADLGDQATDAPITPAGQELMNVSVPDEDGMITVDFNDLFVDGGEAAPEAEAPALAAPVGPTGTEAPEAPAGGLDASAPEAGAEGLGGLPATEEEELPMESMTFESFTHKFNEISTKVDQAYYKKTVSDIVKESLKNKLFDLIETLDYMQNQGSITSRQHRINENKLEFLFLKLKEAGKNHSYNKTNEDDNTMKSLKEFAAQLYEDDQKVDLGKDATSSGETGVPTDAEYSAHAADQSGVSPEIGGPEDIKVAQEDTPLSEEMLPGSAGSVDEDPINDMEAGEKQWADAEPPLDEKDQDKVANKSVNENTADANTDANEDVAEGAAGFGDSDEDPAVEFEVDDKAIAEAVRAIRKEAVRKKMAALREASDGTDSVESWEDGEPEAADPSHSNLKEQAMDMEDDMIDVVDMVDDEAPMDDVDMDVAPEAGEADLVLNVDLPDEFDALLADLTAGDIEVDAGVTAEMPSDDDMPVDDMVGAETEEIVLVDDEEPVEMGMHYESIARKATKKAKLAESRVQKARKLIRSRDARISKLETALQEQNLFTAKAVYLNKFLMREGLSKKAMRQIVEHLDGAKTLAEAKAIYTKIKSKLDEHVKTSRKLAGSASKVTTPGSAKLNESISRESAPSDQVQVTRWQQIAGISPKK